MCLIFFSLHQHPDYKLILAGNRDEFYNRKTSSAAYWTESPEILAGRDLEAGGTWLGVSRSGRISTLTNYRDPGNINPAAPSRGHLVSDFLIGEAAPIDYMSDVYRRGKAYNGFNLLAGTTDDFWYYSNYGDTPRRLGPGVYGLSNHLLDSPWPKVLRGKERLIPFITSGEPDPEKLFNLLFDSDVAPDDRLPSTGLSLDRERALSAMFIKTDGYGSRNSTVLLVDRSDNVFFWERVYDTRTFEHTTQAYSFHIETKTSLSS